MLLIIFFKEKRGQNVVIIHSLIMQNVAFSNVILEGECPRKSKVFVWATVPNRSQAWMPDCALFPYIFVMYYQEAESLSRPLLH